MIASLARQASGGRDGEGEDERLETENKGNGQLPKRCSSNSRDRMVSTVARERLNLFSSKARAEMNTISNTLSTNSEAETLVKLL